MIQNPYSSHQRGLRPGLARVAQEGTLLSDLQKALANTRFIKQGETLANFMLFYQRIFCP